MDRLWSPWRMPYIKNPKPGGCVFCEALAGQDGPGNLIVHRAERGFVILNAFPYTSGHLMALPYEHLPSLEALDQPTRGELIELTTEATRVLGRVYRPQGFNVGINLGAAAGAGLEQHIHIHVVPRWVGDTNFLSTVGETRLLPETLEDTWQKVHAAWPDRDHSG